MKELAGWVDLHRQPALREVDLDLVRPLGEAAANFGLVLLQQVVDELLPRIAGNSFRRVHQAQSRRRDDRLLQRAMRVALRDLEIAVRISLVSKGTGGQPRHAARVPRRERDAKA